MRILISTTAFPPSVGGMETASLFLASGLAERGYDITVVTPMAGENDDAYPFPVVRQPGPATLMRLVRETDLLWQNHIALRLLWPILLTPRPTIFMHHIWLDTNVEAGTKFGGLKRLVCMMGHNAFVSSALRDAARLKGPIIPNSYDEDVFRIIPEIARDRDVAFLGRLTPLKGADILIDAIGLLARKNNRLTTTIIGAGAQEAALRARVASAGISGHVEFSGPLRGEALARMLNRHRILVVPSRWEEPFGIVVLEALASGCVVAVADSGALPEVVGPCGPTFAKDDPKALAAALERLVANPETIADYRRHAPAHLARFTRSAHLDACEELIREAVGEKIETSRAVKRQPAM